MSDPTNDAAAIRDVLATYANRIDAKEIDGLDAVFTSDAHLDHTSTGGPAGPFTEVREWLRASLAPGLVSVHHLTTSRVAVDGDTACSITYVDNPLAGADGKVFIRFDGAYHDTWRRTADGWRISERRLDILSYTGDLPGIEVRIGPPTDVPEPGADA